MEEEYIIYTKRIVINKKIIFFKISPKKRNILNYISFSSILAPKLDNFSTISAYPLKI